MPRYQNALNYIRDVYERLEAINAEEYFLRSKLETKLLIEEELPLTTLIKILIHPGRDVRVLYLGPNQTSDAQIEVTGHQARAEGWINPVSVEITTAYHEHAPWTRKESAERGFSFGPEGFPSDTRSYSPSKLVSVDQGEGLSEIFNEILTVLRAKYEKKYPFNTILVCAVHHTKPFSSNEWAQLANLLWENLGSKVSFSTYILETFSSRYIWFRKTLREVYVSEVGIDEQNRLFLVPIGHRFPLIYREAAGVYWDNEQLRLHSTIPQDGDHFQWFKHIASVLEGNSYQLILKDETDWINVSHELKNQITESVKARGTFHATAEAGK
ncbi:MAG: hypothetical protein J5I65_07670 [Aridibacter famidurans]|nr:hypothetical protein [Aridibacter famidurans]